ncbi:MAG: hypothetical protein ACKVP6_13425 [Mycobacterium sp.]
MIKTLFLVPERDNEDRPYDRGLWRELERRLLDHTVGLTSRADVRGIWRSGDREYRDVSREFSVALESWRQLPALLDLLDWLRVQFRQEAIYLEVAGIPEILT